MTAARAIAFLVAAAAGDARAQVAAPPPVATPAPSARADAPTTRDDAARNDPQATVEIVGPDGEPLSPERQRELRQQLEKDPLPPATDRPPAPPARTPQTLAPASADDGQVVVTGRRPRGSVVGDIPATLSFNPLDIKAYGASDVGELLQTLGPQVSSDRGRSDGGPVVLVNGKRVSSFDEIAKIPTEAIERMEVFPEELALKYGYRADQKVVNIVTYERFSSRVGRTSYAVPTDGGRDTVGAEVSYLHIAGNTRYDFDADYGRSGSLLESERGLLQAPGTGEQGRFRTLLPTADRLSLVGTVSGEAFGGVSASLTGRFEANASESLLGPGGDGPLRRDIDTHAAHLGSTFGGRAGTWLWSLTADYDRTATDTATDVATAAAAAGPRDRARSVNTLANADLVVGGTVVRVPAGAASTSVRIGGALRDFAARSALRGGPSQRAGLSRDTGSVQGNIDVPIASRREKVLPWLGDLSANANLAIEHLSDFGTLTTIGYGLTWSPVGAVNLIASATDEEGAPTVEQVGAPSVVTPNVRTFDFTRGEAVDVTRVFGGNAALRADRRHVARLGINARPVSALDLVLSAEYTRTRIDDPIASFPIATPEIEAAFPDRFTRGSDGSLLRIDGRPLNFDRSDQAKIRWGVNFTRPLGSPPPGMRSVGPRFVGSEADLQKALPPGARIIRPEPGSPAAKRFESIASRLTVSLYYTLTVEDRIRTRDGGPVFDLLDGSATGARGGTSRHAVEVQAGAFKRGLGVRVTARWQSGTTVRGLSAGSAGDLDFADLSTVNLNLFANLADRFGGTAPPAWLKGTRLGISVANLLNSRPDVRDQAQTTPFSFQSAYLDPVGRLVSLDLRKLF